MTEVIIKFTIKVQLVTRSGKNVQIKPKHIESIKSNIKKNAMTNPSGEIVSNKFGIITLKKCDVEFADDTMDFVLKIDAGENYNGDEGDADELIWCVIPAAYSNEDSYKFTFSMDGAKRSETYILNIVDVPNIIYEIV
jgi:hypothetical protein